MIRYAGRPATGAGGVEPIPPPSDDDTHVLGAIMEWGEQSPHAYWPLATGNQIVLQVHVGVVDTASA